MKLIKNASGKKVAKMSKKEWTDIGIKQGWFKNLKSENHKKAHQIKNTIAQTQVSTQLPGQEQSAQQVQTEAQPPSENVNLRYVGPFALQLKSLVNAFAGNVSRFQTTDEALMSLEEIQTVVQKMIGSVQKGSRQNVITNTQAVKQVKTPLVDPRK